jgi:hypothetical protein
MREPVTFAEFAVSGAYVGEGASCERLVVVRFPRSLGDSGHVGRSRSDTPWAQRRPYLAVRTARNTSISAGTGCRLTALYIDQIGVSARASRAFAPAGVYVRSRRPAAGTASASRYDTSRCRESTAWC